MQLPFKHSFFHYDLIDTLLAGSQTCLWSFRCFSLCFLIKFLLKYSTSKQLGTSGEVKASIQSNIIQNEAPSSIQAVATPWGSIKSTKPVCRKLQPTIYNYKLPNSMTLRTTKTTDFRMQRLQTCQPTNLLSFPSQPGGPQGAGGFH